MKRFRWGRADDLELIDFIYQSLKCSDPKIRDAARKCKGKQIWTLFVAKSTRIQNWETAQSRFRKGIMPNIQEYGLSEDKMTYLLLNLTFPVTMEQKERIEKLYNCSLSLNENKEIMDCITLIDKPAGAAEKTPEKSQNTDVDFPMTEIQIPNVDLPNDAEKENSWVEEPEDASQIEMNSSQLNTTSQSVAVTELDIENEYDSLAPTTSEDWYMPVAEFARSRRMQTPLSAKRVAQKRPILTLSAVSTVMVPPTLILPPTCPLKLDRSETQACTEERSGLSVQPSFSYQSEPTDKLQFYIPKPLDENKHWLDEPTRKDEMKKLADTLQSSGAYILAKESMQLVTEYEHEAAESSDCLLAYFAALAATRDHILEEMTINDLLEAGLANEVHQNPCHEQPNPISGQEWHKEFSSTERANYIQECMELIKDLPPAVAQHMTALTIELEASLCESVANKEAYYANIQQLKELLTRKAELFPVQ
ncbi:unnamed protein product, partial [Mesorhabditis spiculigera]